MWKWLLCCLLGGLVLGNRDRRGSSYIKLFNLIETVSPLQKVTVGGTVTLDCNIAEVPLRAELRWVHLVGLDGDVGLLRYSSQRGVEGEEGRVTGQLSQREDGKRLVFQMTMQDLTEKDRGLYQCQVLLDTEPVSTREVLVTVTKSKDKGGGKEKEKTQYIIAKQGGDVTLDCGELGDAEDEVTWRKIGESSVVQSGAKLNLIRVDREDSGVYYCSVTGGLRNHTVTVKVKHKPIVTPVNIRVKQALGYSSSLACTVEAVPVPKVSWYRLNTQNQENATPTQIKSHHSLSITIEGFKDGRLTSSLHFHNVTREHYGNYSCNATNVLGKDEEVLSFEFSALPITASSAHQESCNIVVVVVPLLALVSHR